MSIFDLHLKKGSPSQDGERTSRLRGLKNHKKKTAATVAIITACAIAGGTVWARSGSTDSTGSTRSVQSAEVTTGNISNTIVGTGNLTGADGDSVTIPSGLTIETVEVSEGDSVEKGDVLATVDHLSVLSAMEDVQEEIEDLDEEIADLADSDNTTTVTSSVVGTVTEVHVSAGDSVTDVMAEDGALLTIALAEDENQSVQITAASGTVSSVYVGNGDTVYSGTSLLLLSEDGYSVEYQEAVAQRAELTQTLRQLVTIAQTDTITASESGIIGSVNISAQSTSGSSSKNAGSSANSSSSSARAAVRGESVYSEGTAGDSGHTALTASAQSSAVTGSVTLLSYDSVASMQTDADAAKTSSDLTDSSSDAAGSENEKDTVLEIKIASSEEEDTDGALVLVFPAAGTTAETKIEAADDSFSGEITWKDSDGNEVTTFAYDQVYRAEITLTAGGGYCFEEDSITGTSTGVLSGIEVSDDGKMISFVITCPSTEAEDDSDSSKASAGSTSSEESSSSGSGAGKSGSSSGSGGSSSGSGSSRSTGSGTSSGSSSSGSSSGSSKSSSGTSSSDSSDITAFTFLSDEEMLMSISVDELDINSVSVGQSAEVTLDALEGETFSGTVSEVNNTASSSGSGSAKYTVYVTIPREDSMKEGMSASVTIAIEEADNVLTIPVNALQERGSRTYVYTEADDEGNLSGEVEVATGLSDGDNVEITEGLSEGDTVYYIKTGSTSSSGSSFGGMDSSGMPSFGNGEVPSGSSSGGGGRPSGGNDGERPSGGSGGPGGSSSR